MTRGGRRPRPGRDPHPRRPSPWSGGQDRGHRRQCVPRASRWVGLIEDADAARQLAQRQWRATAHGCRRSGPRPTNCASRVRRDQRGRAEPHAEPAQRAGQAVRRSRRADRLVYAAVAVVVRRVRPFPWRTWPSGSCGVGIDIVCAPIRSQPSALGRTGCGHGAADRARGTLRRAGAPRASPVVMPRTSVISFPEEVSVRQM